MIGADAKEDISKPHSFTETHLPDVEFIDGVFDDALALFKTDNVKIDYLHIDAGYSKDILFTYEACRPILADRFLITIHYARGSAEAIKAINSMRLKDDIELSEFNFMGYCIVVVKPNFATKRVGAPHLKLAAFLRHPFPHTFIRLQKAFYACMPMFRKQARKKVI